MHVVDERFGNIKQWLMDGNSLCTVHDYVSMFGYIRDSQFTVPWENPGHALLWVLTSSGNFTVVMCTSPRVTL